MTDQASIGISVELSQKPSQPVEKVLAELMINQMSLLFKESPKKENKIRTRINDKNMILRDKIIEYRERDRTVVYWRKQTCLRLKKRAESRARDQEGHSNAGSVVFQEIVSRRFIWLPVRRHRSDCLCWKGTPSPPSLFE
jgi:hypothetical protein